MRISSPDPKPRESGDYDFYVTPGYGAPTADIYLDEKHDLALRWINLEDCERLIKAVALAADKLRVYRAQMAALHGRGRLYEGTCQLCGKPEDDELHAEPERLVISESTIEQARFFAQPGNTIDDILAKQAPAS